MVHHPPNWKAADGESTVDRLADVLKPHFAGLVLAGGFGYDSIDMTTGIDVPTMAKWHKSIIDFGNLDPRGAYIGQTDMLAAFTKCAEMDAAEDGYSTAIAKASETVTGYVHAYNSRSLGVAIAKAHFSDRQFVMG